jgi:hypothetical protein
MRKFLLLLLLIVKLAYTDLWAQKITVVARLDSTVLWIGEQTRLSFEVTQQPNQKVSMPIFSDTIVRTLELVEPVKVDTVKSKEGPVHVTHSYIVTAFKDTLLYIPPFPFISNGDTVWSKSLSLKVVQPFKIDTASNKITDIKPVFAPKFDWMGLLKIILIILLIHAILIAAFLIYRKYYKKKTVTDPKEQEKLLPAYVVALSHLDKIKAEKPWQQGRSKEYHTELTDVIREYIERVFDVKSMEMTTDEILSHLQDLKKEDKSAFLELKQILVLADLVKFAKWDALPEEQELSLRNAYSFVNSTKIVDEILPEEPSKDDKSEI